MNFRPNFTYTKDEKGREITEKPQTYESVINYMARDLITFRLDQDINEAIDAMVNHEISGAPVLNDKDELVGIITEKDCLRMIIDMTYHNQALSKSKVADYMTANPITISPENDVLDVVEAFLNSNFRRFPVVDKGKLIGQISRRDILKAAMKIESTTW